MADTLTQTAPERIWLQVNTDGDPADRSEALTPDVWGDLTWHHESIGGQEVRYVREDLADNLGVLGLLADIRAAAGDAQGRLMQPELVEHIGRLKAKADEADTLRAELERCRVDAERLDAVQSEYWAIEPVTMPTPGGDDADVAWRIWDFHQQPPRSRQVLMHYTDDLRAAIDAARAAQDEDPAG